MNIELSIVMPCLNEAETLAACIEAAWCSAPDKTAKSNGFARFTSMAPIDSR